MHAMCGPFVHFHKLPASPSVSIRRSSGIKQPEAGVLLCPRRLCPGKSIKRQTNSMAHEDSQYN